MSETQGPPDYVKELLEKSITGMDVYDNGYMSVNRRGEGAPGAMDALPLKMGGDRGQITYLSQRARSQMLFTLCTTSTALNNMLLLSYGKQYPRDGKACKQHLDRFLKSLRRRWHNVSYFWFLEFQKRGAPHVHVYTDTGEVSNDDREWLGKVWTRCQGINDPTPYTDLSSRHLKCLYAEVSAVHSHYRQWEELRTPDGHIRYAAKYSLKTHQKKVPSSYSNVGRFWGCSKSITQNKVNKQTIQMTAPEVRKALNALDHTTKEWEILPKYLFG